MTMRFQIHDHFCGRYPRWLVVALSVGLLLSMPGAAAAADSEHNQRVEGAGKLKARTAYTAYCATCHGISGDGRAAAGGPTLSVDFTSPAAVAGMTREAMIASANGGHDDKLRATWADTLSTGQIAGIVDYIREAFMLPSPVVDASVGQQIYARACSVCHGERGNAASWAKNNLNTQPRDFTAAETLKLTRRQMINAATYGVDGTAMMPFTTQFSKEEIAAVVDYIRSAFMKLDPETTMASAMRDHLDPAPHMPPGMPQHDHGAGDGDMAAPFPDSLSGNATPGKTFYEANCAECHGIKGDGQGPRAYFMTRKPRNFVSPKARAELNRPHLFASISMGIKQTEMAAWSKVMDAQQIADVAEYVFTAFIAADGETAAGGHSASPPAHSSRELDPVKKN